MEFRFLEIYNKKIWGKGSGTGSAVSSNTEFYIDRLEEIINNPDYNIQIIHDIGCGDWEFSRLINWNDKQYVGWDIPPDLIDRNNELYKTNNINFINSCCSPGNIPFESDLVILRDVMQHWTNEEIEEILPSILKNNKYVLISNGYKFCRDPSKNNGSERNINNRYSYHPLDINITKFKDNVIFQTTRRAKQISLLKGESNHSN